jgi:hypothetical protein
VLQNSSFALANIKSTAVPLAMVLPQYQNSNKAEDIL